MCLAFLNVESLSTVRLYHTEFSRKPILSRMAEYEFTSEGNVKDTQRFTVRYHTVLLYLVPTSQEVSVKSRANQMQM